MGLQVWTAEKVKFNKLDREESILLDSYHKLEDLQKVIDDMDEEQQKKVIAYTQAIDDDLFYAVDDVLHDGDDMYLYEGMSLEDVAEMLVDDGVYGNVSDSLKRYIDFSFMAQELEYDGYYEYEGGVIEYE